MEEKPKGLPASWSRALTGILTIPVVLIVTAGIVIIAIVLILTGTAQSITNSLFSSPPSRATVQLSSTINSALVARARLTTAEKTIRDLQIRVNVRGGIANALGYGATFETDVVAQIGYDLSRPEFKVEAVSDNTVRISLPRAELLACSMTPPQETDRSTSMTADWNAARELGSFMLMQGAVAELLDNADNFDGARAGARQTIEQIVQGINRDLIVEFEFADESGERRVDDTCRLRSPLLWTYDADDGYWVRS